MPVVNWGYATTLGQSTTGPKTAVLDNGGFVLVWTTGAGTPNAVIHYQIFDPGGYARGEVQTVGIPGGGALADPDVAATDGGGFVITFTFLTGADESAAYQMFNTSGTPYSTGYLGALGNVTEHDASATRIKTFAEDKTGFAWVEDDLLYYKETSGFALTLESGGEPSSPVVVASDGVFEDAAVFWLDLAFGEDTYAIRGQVIRDGVAVDVFDPVLQTDDGGSFSDLSAQHLGGGRYVLVWSDFTDVQSMLVEYNSASDQFERVGAFTTIPPVLAQGYDTTVEVLADGSYVVTYVLYTFVGAEAELCGRRFDRDGRPLGSEFIIGTGDMAEEPDIALMTDGRLVVSWRDETSGEARFQVIDPREGVVNGTRGHDNLYGNDLYNDQITSGTGYDLLVGMNGNDRLDGGRDYDTMIGGVGDDTYIVDNYLDLVIEAAGEGIDTVASSISFDASEGRHQAIENITLTGTAQINATGYNGKNILVGNRGNNELNGKGGDDIMTGGLGDDVYVVDRLGDVVRELPGGGADTVKAVLSWVLDPNVERLILAGVGNFDATGNSLDNTIVGNAQNNVVTGGLGRDVMSGGGGNDTFDFTARPRRLSPRPTGSPT